MWKCSSYAGMMELVDMRDLGSRAAMRWGSSPHARTKNKTICQRQMVLFLAQRVGFEPT